MLTLCVLYISFNNICDADILILQNNEKYFISVKFPQNNNYIGELCCVKFEI